jgi:hypothetical protein
MVRSVDRFATEEQGEDMSSLEHLQAHTDTVVLVHRRKRLDSEDHSAMGTPFVWLKDPRSQQAPIDEDDRQDQVYLASGDTSVFLTEEDSALDTLPEGFEDIGLGALSDLELLPPRQLPEGFDDVDFGALPDLELPRPRQPPESTQPTASPPVADTWPRAVSTAVGLIQMDLPLFQGYERFMAFQGK